MIKSISASARDGLAAWLLLPLAALVLVLAGCGGGGAAQPLPSATTTANSKVYVGLTDADGDFLSYTVDVVSLQLQRADGTTVETLPTRTRVDFANLTDLTEFVTAATIPQGVYVSGKIRLDYTNAAVTVEVNGQPEPAQVVGTDGQPLGVVDLDVQLDNANQLVVAPGVPGFMQLDFDLAASHTVDLTTTPVTATASPFIVASLVPATDKDLRIRGALVDVNPAGSSYTVNLRPFHLRNAALGEMTVHTTADTSFEIDGSTYTGTEGLQALAAAASGTATVALGTLSVADKTFTAIQVRAGSSVAGTQFDGLHGNVVARSGDSLTVRGATLIRRDGEVDYVRGDVTVQLGSGTRVLHAGEAGDTSIAAISVGQRIQALGDASESGGIVTVDATQGLVRLVPTRVYGSVVSAQPGELALDLSAIDGRRPSVFDFSGTGLSPDVDADPANYQVATGPLAVDGFSAGQPAMAIGFVSPFGEAPPDFQAHSIANIASLPAVAGIGWTSAGTAAPFTRLDGEGLVIDTANPDIGLRHQLVIGWTVSDLQQLAAPLTIIPAQGPGLYAIGEPGRVRVFIDFARFAAALSDALGGGARARAMTAAGQYDAPSVTLTARRVSVALIPPT